MVYLSDRSDFELGRVFCAAQVGCNIVTCPVACKITIRQAQACRHGSQSYGAHSRTKFKSAVKPLILH